MAAATPADFVRNASVAISRRWSPADREQGTQAALKQLQGAERLLRLDQIEKENRHLRALLDAREASR